MKLLAKMRHHHVHGFTLVELLRCDRNHGRVIGPTDVGGAKDSGRRAQGGLANKLIQIGLALHDHVSIYSIFPPQPAYSRQYASSSYAYEGIGWPVYILPFMERDKLWQQTLSAYALDPSPGLCRTERTWRRSSRPTSAHGTSLECWSIHRRAGHRLPIPHMLG